MHSLDPSLEVNVSIIKMLNWNIILVFWGTSREIWDRALWGYLP